MNNLQINDIKALVSIPDLSFYLFVFLLILGLVFIFILIFSFYKIYINKTKNIRKGYYLKLEALDLKESKNSAYIITKYARLLAQTKIEKNLCDELVEELENFKYKKDVKPLNNNVKILFERFMDIVDV